MKIIEIRTDDELALSLERRARSESKTLEAVAAEALLLYARCPPPQRKTESQTRAPYRIKPFASGKCLLDDLSNTAQALAWAEGEDFR